MTLFTDATCGHWATINQRNKYGNISITLTKYGRHVDSKKTVTGLFNKSFSLPTNKAWKLRIIIPWCKESTGDRGIPATKGQWLIVRLHIMILSCTAEWNVWWFCMNTMGHSCSNTCVSNIPTIDYSWKLIISHRKRLYIIHRICMWHVYGVLLYCFHKHQYKCGQTINQA